MFGRGWSCTDTPLPREEVAGSNLELRFAIFGNRPRFSPVEQLMDFPGIGVRRNGQAASKKVNIRAEDGQQLARSAASIGV
jgi:hypothetical protein